MMTRPMGWNSEVGTMRIRFFQNPCGPATCIGLVKECTEGFLTFAKYDPKDKKKFHGIEEEVKQKSALDKCCWCSCADKCIEKGMVETVEYACDGHITLDQYFKKLARAGQCRACLKRFGTFLILNLCLYMIFIPNLWLLCYNWFFFYVGAPGSTYITSFILTSATSMIICGTAIFSNKKCCSAILVLLGTAIWLLIFILPIFVDIDSD